MCDPCLSALSVRHPVTTKRALYKYTYLFISWWPQHCLVGLMEFIITYDNVICSSKTIQNSPKISALGYIVYGFGIFRVFIAPPILPVNYAFGHLCSRLYCRRLRRCVDRLKSTDLHYWKQTSLHFKLLQQSFTTIRFIISTDNANYRDNSDAKWGANAQVQLAVTRCKSIHERATPHDLATTERHQILVPLYDYWYGDVFLG